MSGRTGCEGRGVEGPWLGPEPHLGEPLAGAHWKDRQAGVGGPVASLVFLLCLPVWVSASPSLWASLHGRLPRPQVMGPGQSHQADLSVSPLLLCPFRESCPVQQQGAEGNAGVVTQPLCVGCQA